MKNKHGKLFLTVVLIFWLALSLIGIGAYLLPKVSGDMSKLIYGNPVTYILNDIFSSVFAYFITIPLTTGNVIYAFVGLRGTLKKKEPKQKRIVTYVIYAVISLGTLVLSYIALNQTIDDLVRAFRSFR